MNLRQAAQQAGLWEILTRYTKVFAGKSADPENLIWSDLEHFAALVAAQEREECAKVCDGYNDGRYANTADLCAAAIRSRT